MKKLALAFAFIGFIAFAANAQTAQTTDTKKETTVKTSDAPATKACCAAKKDTKACKEAEGKGCCKGKSKAECNHADASSKTGEEKSSGSEAPAAKPASTK